ncbi:MAG TPA: hypothetical protein VJU16_09110, partial [Planctomycetota bacterium]|nr:hypothetical protein [Planctomycetota bacterium]
MRIAAFLLLLLSQAQSRVEPEAQLAEAKRLGEFALFDRAEEILRSYLKASPAEPQLQKMTPEFRAALCEVLLAARKYDDLKVEADPLRKNPKTRVHALSILAAGAWHAGQIAEALEFCDEGDKAAADPGST